MLYPSGGISQRNEQGGGRGGRGVLRGVYCGLTDLPVGDALVMVLMDWLPRPALGSGCSSSPTVCAVMCFGITSERLHVVGGARISLGCLWIVKLRALGRLLCYCD